MIAENLEDIYELSPLQHGILFHSLYAPESEVYFEQLNCTLRGDMNVPAFKEAWERVINLHPVLRTAIHWEDLDKPYQVVFRQVQLPWEFLDWRGLSPSDQQEQLKSFLQNDRHHGFELTAAPLMRLFLIQTAEDRYQFIWSFHHLLLDGWSLTLLLKEVLDIYEGYCEGREIEPAPSRPYQDYIVWLQRQELAGAEAFWREMLKGFTAPTALGVDLAPGNLQGPQGYGEQRREIPSETTAALNAFARQHKLTLNTLAQAAWAILLSRYSGEEDVVFGTTVSGRPTTLPGVESMVGLFINTLPMRAQVVADEPLLNWLRRLQERQVDMRQYEYSPLVQVHGWSEVPRGMPLFESILAFESYPIDDSLRNGRRRLEFRDSHIVERTNYPLGVVVIPGGELSVRVFYDRGRFNDPMIGRLLGHYERLLGSIVADPERRLCELEMLTEAEEQQLLVEWNQTATPYPRHQTIHQLFEAHAERTPDAVAVAFEQEQLTYQELNARANQVARYLRDRGVGPEVLVGILAERSIEMVVGLLGVLKAGGAYVPLDPNYPAERLSYMLADSEVPVLLAQERVAERLPTHHAEVVYLDRDWEGIAEQSTENFDSGAGPENLAYVIYTSGSTGRPKGAMIEHRGLSNLAEAELRAFGLRPDDRVLQFASLSFDASIFEMVMALKTGATICLATPESLMSGPALVELLREQAITNVTLPPSVVATLPEEELPALRTVTVAGEACPADLVERWAKGRRFFNLYGPTETTVWATYAECFDGSRRPPIGRPIANTQIYILDRYLQPVPVGVAGELHIGGDGLARGYLKRAELTTKKFIPNPFSTETGARLFKTGDLARYLPDGNIEFLGRIDHQVKVRGFRIELGEIEAVLGEHEGVRESVVVVREDEGGEKRLVAYVVGRQAGTDLTVIKLRNYLKERLPHYMVPAAIVVLEEMPLTRNGKIDRRALPTPDEARPESGETYVSPQTEAEQTVAAAWQEVLKLERVGRDDNFFDLGGHSLLITQVHGRLRKAFNRELSIIDIFKYPTVSSLARYLSQDQTERTLEGSRSEGGQGGKESVAAVNKQAAQPTLQQAHYRAEMRLESINRRQLGRER